MEEVFGVARHTHQDQGSHPVAPFIGRRQELGQIKQCLQDVLRGQPRVVLVQGEAGIGKTRFLKEVQEAATYQGVQICASRCHEDLILPYFPFVDTLLSQFEQSLGHAVSPLNADVAVIRRLRHRGSGTSFPAAPHAPERGEQEKLRFFLAVSRATMTLAQQQPMLFVVDDLHWADQPSLDLFAYLVFRMADTATQAALPLCIMGTHRPVESETRLARFIARFQRESLYQSLELFGLNESDMRELLHSLGVMRPSYQFFGTLNNATHGNPLFTQEIVHHLVHKGALQEQGGYLVADTASMATLQLPERVTDAIAIRLQSLSEDRRQILTLAAFLGERFSLHLLQTVSEMPEDTLLDVLEEGIRQHVLLNEDQSFQFAHPLTRHAFYNAPSTMRRQRIHLRIAQALEHLYGNSLEAHMLEVAYHLIGAGPMADAKTVMMYARQAGDQAFAMFAWSDAAQYYEAALAAAELTGNVSPHHLATLHYQAGQAYQRATDAGPCLHHYDKAIEAYRRVEDVRGQAQALIEKTRLY